MPEQGRGAEATTSCPLAADAFEMLRTRRWPACAGCHQTSPQPIPSATPLLTVAACDFSPTKYNKNMKNMHKKDNKEKKKTDPHSPPHTDNTLYRMFCFYSTVRALCLFTSLTPALSLSLTKLQRPCCVRFVVVLRCRCGELGSLRRAWFAGRGEAVLVCVWVSVGFAWFALTFNAGNFFYKLLLLFVYFAFSNYCTIDSRFSNYCNCVFDNNIKANNNRHCMK